MRIVVTGGNSGIGQATAAELSAAGHHVVIACRTMSKGEKAAAEMSGEVEVCHLDLADLTSVRRFAASVGQVDVLVNNAGVLGLPLSRTADGFEAHIGTNHLGHFALTCLLGEQIRDRVVVVSSVTYRLARMHFDDLNWHTRRYSRWAAYAESKLADMLFVDELARRGVRTYLSDPGFAASGITRNGGGWLRWGGEHVLRFIAPGPAAAARSTIAAVTTDLPSGSCLAPRLVMWGVPGVTTPGRKARDPVAARLLWERSAELTGCNWACGD